MKNDWVQRRRTDGTVEDDDAHRRFHTQKKTKKKQSNGEQHRVVGLFRYCFLYFLFFFFICFAFFHLFVSCRALRVRCRRWWAWTNRSRENQRNKKKREMGTRQCFISSEGSGRMYTTRIRLDKGHTMRRAKKNMKLQPQKMMENANERERNRTGSR